MSPPEAGRNRLAAYAPRYVLRPVNGGYKIERLVADYDFRPPMWISAGYFGPRFATREDARQHMIATADERRVADAA